jgi:hypothetical protein
VRSSYRPSFPETSLTLRPSRNYCKKHPTCVSSEYLFDCHNINSSDLNSNNILYLLQKTKPVQVTIFCIKRQKSIAIRTSEVLQLLFVIGMLRMNVVWKKWKKVIKYIILSRQKHVRELLIIPINHQTNRDLIKDALFWKWILEKVINNFLMKFRKKPYLRYWFWKMGVWSVKRRECIWMSWSFSPTYYRRGSTWNGTKEGSCKWPCHAFWHTWKG